jgi:Na+-driven multidrug efflux pump
MGVQIVMISLAMIAMISMVNEHGVQTASAYSAALQLWTYVQMPAMAIGAACSSMAAQNVGASGSASAPRPMPACWAILC